MKRYTRNTTIALDSEVYQRILQLARAESRSVSSVIRRLIESAMKGEKYNGE